MVAVDERIADEHIIHHISHMQNKHSYRTTYRGKGAWNGGENSHGHGGGGDEEELHC